MPAEKRRTYRTGAVYQRATDGLWIGTFEAGYTKTGGRRRISVSAKSELEAKRKLARRQRQAEKAGPAVMSSRATVKSWADEWLPIVESRLRPKSYATKASDLRLWIVPTIGHKRLEQLTPADVRAVRAALKAAGRSSTTARNVHWTLVALLKAAKVEGHNINENVFMIDGPEKAVSDRLPVTMPEALAILRVASELTHGSRWAVALLHGMRQAECLGLTWDAVNLETGEMVVEWQLQALPYIDRHDKARGFRVPDGFEAVHLVDALHLTRPKSQTGFRVVPLIPAMRQALTAWREECPETPWGLVWPAVDGRPASSKQDLTEWHALQCTAGVGHPKGRYYHLHEARHVTATQLMETGADPTTIMALMGHSSIVTSRGYMHTDRTVALAAMEKLGARLEL